MSTQLTKKQDIKSIINSDQMREQFARALPKHLSPERFARVAITALTRTPKLTECTPASLMKCLLDLSAMGLEPDGRRAHLIPYGKEATLVIDYKGLVELIRRSGDVASIRAETVCENDSFAWTNGQVHHAVDWRQPRGKVQAVYAEAVMKSGERQSAVMTHDEVEAIRKRSKAGNSGPWVTDWAEMAKKTAVRRLSKMLPLSSEIMQHVEADDNQFAGMRNITPNATPPAFMLPDAAPEPTIEAENVAAPIEDQPDQAWGDESAQ
jgi:recombination protein RecT